MVFSLFLRFHEWVVRGRLSRIGLASLIILITARITQLLFLVHISILSQISLKKKKEVCSFKSLKTKIHYKLLIKYYFGDNQKISALGTWWVVSRHGWKLGFISSHAWSTITWILLLKKQIYFLFKNSGCTLWFKCVCVWGGGSRCVKIFPALFFIIIFNKNTRDIIQIPNHSHKIYNLTSFSILTIGATVITISYRTFHHPQKYLLAVSPCSSPSPGQPLIYYLSMDLPILDISCK